MKSVCLACSLLIAAPAMGQDVVVVSGDRLGESRTESILPVSLLSERDIVETGAHHPAELINQAPGVFLHRGNGAEHLTAIRSPVLTGGAGAGSFLYLEDGIPLRAAGFTNVNGLFESLSGLTGGVEIVRGPGPALYGSNALHGLVNLRTPTAGDAVNYLELEAGSFGRYRGRGVWSRAGETVSTLIGLSGQHEDGWREDAGLDRIDALFRADGQSRGIDWRFTTAIISLNQETAGFVFGPQTYRDRTVSQGNADPEAYRDAQAVRSALRLEGPVGAGWRWALTPFARHNEMDFLMHFVPSEALEESGHTSLGLQSALVHDGAAGRVTLGADLERTAGYLRETQKRPTIFSFVQGDHYDYTVDADVFALYAQGRWQMGEAVTLHAGARWENTRFDYDNRLAANTVGRFQRLADRSDEFDVLTPNLGLVWQVDEAGIVFARIARGSRAPQTAELYRLQRDQVIDAIEPEVLDSAEIGYRRDLGGRGRVELVAYAMRKRNVFFRDADGLNVTDGRTRHQGIEFDLALDLSDGLTARIAGSWAEHSYDFDRPVGRASEVIRKGARIDTAPDWLWTAGLDWAVSDQLTARLDWVHVGEYFTDAANEHAYDGHDVFNLRARYRLSETAEIFGAVRNLTDESYAERADFAFGNDRYFPGEPRAISLGIRLTR